MLCRPGETGVTLKLEGAPRLSLYDFIVIGSGPAGRRAAVQAAKIGKSVLVVEKGREVGGVSVHTGTIPSKTLRETVLNLTGYRERGFYGRAYRVKQDIGPGDLMKRMQMTLSHEVDVLEHQFARNGVKTMFGAARFLDPHKLEVTSPEGEISVVEGAKILIAVGTRPYRAPYIPFNGENVLDSDEIIDIRRVPRSLTVIGAGVIGVEYATIFSALDVAVTLIDPQTGFLNFVDRELIEDLTFQMRDQGVTLRLGAKVERIDFEDGAPVAHLSDGRRARSEMMLFTGGREGATDTLNLAACGLTADARGRLKVHPDTFCTGVEHIYAAGDVIGFPSLASTSMEQGRIAAGHAFGVPVPHHPEFFPYGIYSVPEISMVGMTEQEMHSRGIPYESGIARFRETSRGHIMGLEWGMMKLIFSLKTRRLLGAHIIGEGATELIHIGQAVMNLKGTLDFFIENTFNYPTLAEAYKIAALDAWNRMPNTSQP